MISYLEGTIINSSDKAVIIKSGTVGWRVFLGPNTLDKIQKNKGLVKVFTYLYSRENSQELYGFRSFKELQFFELLLSVSGVGPRHAQLILDFLATSEVAGVIQGEKSEIFTRVPGIGSKIAKKIIIDLKPKFKRLGLLGEVDVAALTEKEDAIEALYSLGYRKSEAKEALDRVAGDVKGISGRVEEALKILGKPRRD